MWARIKLGNMEFLITTRNNIITVIITDQRNMGAFIRQGCVLLNNMWVVLHRGTEIEAAQGLSD